MMANDDLNTDQDINTTPPDGADQYPAQPRSHGSNPDLDVAGYDDQTRQRDQGASPYIPGAGARQGSTSEDTADTEDDAETPVMARGGDLASTDIMSQDGGPGSTDIMSQDGTPDAVGQAPTDTTTGDDYSTGPRTTDPEQELLNSGYEPQIDRDATGPDRAGHRVPPGVPGMPDQRGTLDQTTYSTQDDGRS
jgi:hypothetical protein